MKALNIEEKIREGTEATDTYRREIGTKYEYLKHSIQDAIKSRRSIGEGFNADKIQELEEALIEHRFLVGGREDTSLKCFLGLIPEIDTLILELDELRDLEQEISRRSNRDTIVTQKMVEKKYKLLPCYEKAVWLYRAADKNNKKLIELSDLDEDTEPKKTVTPREVNTRKLKPYISMIEYIDSVAYNESIRIEERLLELRETKSLRVRAYEAKETDLTEKVYTETISWLERVIFDLESIKSNREAVQERIKNRNFLLDWEISQLLNRGKISLEEGLKETQAAEAGIEDLVFLSVPLDIWNDELMYYHPIKELYGLDELITQRVKLFGLHAQLIGTLKNQDPQPATNDMGKDNNEARQDPGKTLLQDSDLNMFAEAAAEGKLTPTNDGKYIVHKSLPDVLEYFQKQGYTYTPQYIRYWVLKKDGSPFAPSSVERYCKRYPTKTNQKAREARDKAH